MGDHVRIQKTGILINMLAVKVRIRRIQLGTKAVLALKVEAKRGADAQEINTIEKKAKIP